MNIQRNRTISSFNIGTQWPFISYNILREDCCINDKQYKYRSHGGWFMLLGALIPLVWSGCPWTWSVGLLCGTLLALVTNIVSYLVYHKKVRNALMEISKPMTLDPTKTYFMGMDSDDMLTMTLNDVKYLIVSESAHSMEQLLAGKGTSFTPVVQHIDTILYHAKKNQLDIGLLTADGDQIMPLDRLMEIDYTDMLDEKMQKGETLYAVVFEKNGRPMYAASADSRMIMWLNADDAKACAQRMYETYQIQALSMNDVVNIVDGANGIIILNKDSLVLYNKASEDIIPFMRKYCSSK